MLTFAIGLLGGVVLGAFAVFCWIAYELSKGIR